ncbi:MAG: DUF971 domain-containing protein [Pseudomonadota bacterium]
MAGLRHDTPIPQEIILNQASRTLELVFADGQNFVFSCEFLRVFSPSAEARGHGLGQEILQVGKRQVSIEQIERVGHYAIQPIFSDGHRSALYSWDLLYELGTHQEQLWQTYLDRLAANKASRDPLPDPLPASQHDVAKPC